MSKTTNQRKMIDRLISDDIDTIKQGEYLFIQNILELGFNGYYEYTDAELRRELIDRDINPEEVCKKQNVQQQT